MTDPVTTATTLTVTDAPATLSYDEALKLIHEEAAYQRGNTTFKTHGAEKFFDKKVENAVGNVMDDVFAGLYGRACMALLLWVWP